MHDLKHHMELNLASLDGLLMQTGITFHLYGAVKPFLLDASTRAPASEKSKSMRNGALYTTAKIRWTAGLVQPSVTRQIFPSQAKHTEVMAYPQDANRTLQCRVFPFLPAASQPYQAHVHDFPITHGVSQLERQLAIIEMQLTRR